MPSNPEFPTPDPGIDDDNPDAPLLPEDDDVILPEPGEGLVEPAGVPFDEEIERVVQPEPAGD